MKRFFPILCLLLATALAAGGMLLLGGSGLNRRPDHDPASARTGALFSHLRDGQRFTLDEAYPQSWDLAQFVLDAQTLTGERRGKLYAYDAALASEAQPLLLLWRKNELWEAVPLPNDTDGYPRFFDALGGGNFSISREDAVFECAFVEGTDGRGGYYECTPVGKAA